MWLDKNKGNVMAIAIVIGCLAVLCLLGIILYGAFLLDTWIGTIISLVLVAFLAFGVAKMVDES